MTDLSPAFSRLLAPQRLAGLDGRSLSETATEAERRAVASAFGLVALDALRVEARIAREGREGWRVEGRVEAEAVQECVVSLEPVAARIDEAFLRRYDPAATEEAAEAVIDPEAEDPPEPLGHGVDLGLVALETLALALDPYPRAPGAAFEPVLAAPEGVEPLTDEAAKPFAGLAALKSRLGGDGGGA